jgi:hypothetical protein
MTGRPVNPEAMWTMMKQLRNRIVCMLENDAITDNEERLKLECRLQLDYYNSQPTLFTRILRMLGSNPSNPLCSSLTLSDRS